MSKKHTIHVISHTHWDREWYLPFELFRIRLVDLVDKLLDLMDRDPEYKYFNLDGQGIILEDYLKIRPENRDRLKKRIEEGRITIGPWYVLNDEYLVSGESTVRSLLIGHKVVSEFGPVMKVGYLPDQFGNISQMPQILRNFGIDNCIFGRGRQIVGDRKMEFCWKSPDGSEVLASLMAFWYNNAQEIPADTASGKAAVDNMCEAMKPIAASSHLLFMNGVDHLEPQYNLSTALKNLQGRLDGDEIAHSTLPKYVDAVWDEVKSGKAKLEEVIGELREDRWSSCLAGVLSARIYLKQANERGMRALEKYAEPASAMAYLLGSCYRAGELEYAWKLLMENHPHDSICGCSVDEVHAEMMPRFQKVEQLGGEVKDRALAEIASRVEAEGQTLVVFNTLTWPRTDVVRATIDIPLGVPDRANPQQNGSQDWPAIEVICPLGQSVPYTLISSQKVCRRVLHPEKLPMGQWVRRFELEFIAQDVPAMGYKTYSLRKTDFTPDFSSRGETIASSFLANSSMHNDLLQLDLGTTLTPGFTIYREAVDGDEALGGQWLSGISLIEDSGDVGDEYNYVKPDRDFRVTSEGAVRQVKLIHDSYASATAEVNYEMLIPKSATPDETGRSEENVPCPVSIQVKMYRGIPRVEFEVTIDNRSTDHRMRAVFPSDTCAEMSHAGGAFDVLERPLKMPADWPMASKFHPMEGWVDVSGVDGGLAVLVDGLREYELYDDVNRSLAVTLIRSVGRLSGGLETPDVQYTPDAQCLGINKSRYAVYPHRGDWKDGQVWKHSLNYNVPLCAVQLENGGSGEIGRDGSFAGISNDLFVPSALKKEQSGDGVVFRFYNIDDKEQSGEVYLKGAKKAWKANMLEERFEELPLNKEKVQLSARGREIVTLIFEV